MFSVGNRASCFIASSVYSIYYGAVSRIPLDPVKDALGIHFYNEYSCILKAFCQHGARLLPIEERYGGIELLFLNTTNKQKLESFKSVMQYSIRSTNTSI